MCKTQTYSLSLCQSLANILTRAITDQPRDANLTRDLISMLVDIAIVSNSGSTSNPQFQNTVHQLLLFAGRNGYYPDDHQDASLDSYRHHSLLTFRLPTIINKSNSWELFQSLLKDVSQNRGKWTEEICNAFLILVENSYQEHIADHPDRILVIYETLTEAIKHLDPSHTNPWFYLNLRNSILKRIEEIALKLESSEILESEEESWIKLLETLFIMSLPATEREWKLERFLFVEQPESDDKLANKRVSLLTELQEKKTFEKHPTIHRHLVDHLSTSTRMMFATDPVVEYESDNNNKGSAAAGAAAADQE